MQHPLAREPGELFVRGDSADACQLTVMRIVSRLMPNWRASALLVAPAPDSV
jgi:hypothetical protein